MHGGEDRARGIDVRGGRNSMNRYRLAAHFASRSCDGLVKRFGLSSPTLPTSLLLLLLLLLHQHQHIANTRTSPRVALFFHCTPPRRLAGVVKRISGVVGHSGFSKRKTSHEECVLIRVFHGVEEGGGGDESDLLSDRTGDIL